MTAKETVADIQTGRFPSLCAAPALDAPDCMITNRRIAMTRRLKRPNLPVPQFSGFPGAGKSTLMGHIRTNCDGKRIAVIVNDMSEVNIDVDLIRDGVTDLSCVEQTLVEMTNGRI